MSQRESNERPDSRGILDILKDFQRDTVEYVFDRLYQAPDSTRRFLVADEVGLGKTLVARGVIGKVIDHLWEGPDRVDQINIVYICSNAQIAKQNVQRLQIGNSKFVRADRLTLLPRETCGLRENRVNYFAFTPETSLNLRSKLGDREERILLYHLVQRVWPDPHTGPKNLFQGRVRDARKWRCDLKKFKEKQRIDAALAEDYGHRLHDEGKGLREKYTDLCKRFQRVRKWIPGDDRRIQAELIGRLRSLLAEVCVTALEPNLVILDEFQRFKYLLDGDDATSRLAKRLFTHSNKTSRVRLLLLSATPYRMYTLHHETTEDDHYQDFLSTVEFLDPGLEESGELRWLLDDYRQALYRIESGTQALEQSMQEIETRLRRVIARTERLRASDAADMLLEVPCDHLELTGGDVSDFLALQQIGREVDQPQVLDYWKSAPYLLSFMDDYRIKSEVAARLPSSRVTGLAKLLTGSGKVFLCWKDVEAYARLDPANARLRSILGWLDQVDGWQGFYGYLLRSLTTRRRVRGRGLARMTSPNA